MTRKLDYLVFDADNHMYEATDAFTKYLPDEYAGVIKYVEVNGRTKIAIKNKISDYIPNPTFNKVAPPGAQELEFKLKNPDSMTAADKELQLAPPPKYIEAPAAFFEPEARVMMMDEQGIDRAMMWPTLASLLEERLTDDPVATHVVVHALNQWMHEQWTFNFENRIFPTPGHHAADRRQGDRGARVGRRARRQGDPGPARAGPRLQRPSPFVRAPRVRPVLGRRSSRADVVVGHARVRQRVPALRERVGRARRRVPAVQHEAVGASTTCSTPTTA